MAHRIYDRVAVFLKGSLLLSLLCIFFVTGHEACAQVEVDNSALGALDNYQPPPMFGGASSVEVNPLPDKKIPPTAPPTEKPSALLGSEDLLAHPVENLHVFTRQMDSTPKPTLPAKNSTTPLLPFPDTVAEVKDVAKETAALPPPIPLRKATPKGPDANNFANNFASNFVSESKMPAPRKGMEKPQPQLTKSDAYRPKAPQSMPAVPSGEVEKVALAAPSSPVLPAPVTSSSRTESKVVLDFTGVSGSELQQGQKDKLANTIIAHLRDSVQRVLIIAYAASTDGTESSARRLSLARALSVRDFLIASSIDSGRIDVRAMANKTDSVPVDRVDIVF